MTVAISRMVIMVAYFMVAFFGILAATTEPASAHPDGMHDFAAVSETHATDGEIPTVETCCHKMGTCVVQFVQFSPAAVPLDGSLTTLQHGFAAERRASISSATDPPPPRP